MTGLANEEYFGDATAWNITVIQTSNCCAAGREISLKVGDGEVAMKKTGIVSLVLGLMFVLLVDAPARAQAVPKVMRGTIIANSKPINIPTSAKGFVKKLRRQDRKVFSKNAEGRWEIHFVAFFKRPLPGEKLGVVVLDAKKEPVAVADVAGTKGQKTLSTHILVDTTETPKKKHILRVFYAKGNKAIPLAEKQIILK